METNHALGVEILLGAPDAFLWYRELLVSQYLSWNHAKHHQQYLPRRGFCCILKQDMGNVGCWNVATTTMLSSLRLRATVVFSFSSFSIFLFFSWQHFSPRSIWFDYRSSPHWQSGEYTVCVCVCVCQCQCVYDDGFLRSHDESNATSQPTVTRTGAQPICVPTCDPGLSALVESKRPCITVVFFFFVCCS